MSEVAGMAAADGEMLERIDALLDWYDVPRVGELGQATAQEWLSALAGIPLEAIERACSVYAQDHQHRPPKVSDIVRRAETKTGGARAPDPQGVATKAGAGDRTRLSAEERRALEEQLLPQARRWLTVPGLADHGRRFLAFWGEST